MMRRKDYSYKKFFLFGAISVSLSFSSFVSFAFAGFLLFSFYVGVVISPMLILLTASTFLAAACLATFCIAALTFYALSPYFSEKKGYSLFEGTDSSDEDYDDDYDTGSSRSPSPDLNQNTYPQTDLSQPLIITSNL